jgi:hypothetical protein
MGKVNSGANINSLSMDSFTCQVKYKDSEGKESSLGVVTSQGG